MGFSRDQLCEGQREFRSPRSRLNSFERVRNNGRQREQRRNLTRDLLSEQILQHQLGVSPPSIKPTGPDLLPHAMYPTTYDVELVGQPLIDVDDILLLGTTDFPEAVGPSCPVNADVNFVVVDRDG